MYFVINTSYKVEMHKYSFIQINPEVTLIEDADTCIYVVEGENSAVVIDTGYGFYNLKEAVNEITLKPLTVICTHAHIDHAFGAHYFDKVYIHKDDMPVYEEHKELRLTLKDELISGYHAKPEDVEGWINAAPKNIEFASYGQIFDIGENILEVVSLRGHTPGSIGLIDKKHKLLFSGDGIINHVWMQLPESTSLAEYLETIQAIKQYKKDFDTIYTGHRRGCRPASFIDNVEEALKDILAGCMGKPYDNQMTGGMIYKRRKCEIVYNPDKIR